MKRKLRRLLPLLLILVTLSGCGNDDTALMAEVKQTSYNQGYVAAGKDFDAGYEKGYNAGQSDGYADGYSAAKKELESSASEEAYQSGYDAALDDAVAAMQIEDPNTGEVPRSWEEFEEYQRAAPPPTPEPTVAPTPEPTPAPTLAPTPEPTQEPAPVERSAPMVWIPTNGGKKYHRTSTCSGMKNPRQVTRDEAISLGFGACKKCW